MNLSGIQSVEAMYFDLKIISTNCKCGPIEILENGTLELIPTESPIELA